MIWKLLKQTQNGLSFYNRTFFCSTSSKTAVNSNEKMVRILNVAEKNDAAKSLADLMSGGHFGRREGFSRFNKIYEFDYNILNRNSSMTMTSVSGHLLNNDFSGQYKHWNSVNPVELFDAPVVKYCPENYVDIKRTLEREIRGCQSLIIWTDGDREGENIGFEIIDVCRAVKPNIQVYRARFSEITRGAIQRAVNNLLPPDQNTSDAVNVRMELDLRIGAAFTRFQTMRLKKVFPDVLAEQLISYGSCQFPTLGFVVERYKQVQAFIPEPFWKINVSHKTDEGLCEFTWKRQRLFDHLACLVFFEHIIENPLAEVMAVKSKPKSKWRPVALDTVELEKSASRKMKINAKETMRIAEKLYTQGLISYPRTETNMFAKDLDLAGMVQLQTQDPDWGGFANNLLQSGGPNPRNGNKSDKAHPPIHPIKYTHGLQGNEAKIYEFIVRHFLACCSADAKGQETIVEIQINEETFTASGLMIIEKNYLRVYKYESWNSKTIPVFEVGEQFEPTKIEMNQGETSPPSLLTEADLISLMDKHGIGTDATHADHIETIKSRLYVGVRPDGKLVPGELGMGLVEGYDAMGYEMSKPHLRAELEADLKRICDGHKNKDAVLQEQIQKYKEVFIEACRQADKIDGALSQYFGDAQPMRNEDVSIQTATPVMPCNKCGHPMVLKTKKDGKGLFLSCMGFPECKNVTWFPDFVLEATVDETRCTNCNPSRVQKIKFKFKRSYVPPDMATDSHYIGCVVCDSNLKEVLGIKTNMGGPSQSNSNPNGTRGYSTSNSNSRTNNNNNRGGSKTSQQGANQTPQRNNRNSSVGSDSGFYSSTQNSSTNLYSGNNSGNFTNGGNTNNTFGGNSRNNLNRSGGNTGGSSYGSTGSGGNSGPGLLKGSNSGSGSNTRQFSAGPASGLTRGGNMGDGDASNGLNDIVCGCSERARLLTVKKSGQNCGRQFYTCPKPQDSNRCGFFLWADESPDDNNDRGAKTYSTNSGFGGSMDSGSESKCNCGSAAKLLTVNKEGPNKGRQFYSCPKPPQESRCSFFQWEDQENSTGGRGDGGGGGGASNTGAPNYRRNSLGSGPLEHMDTDNGGTQCKCNDNAKLLTVQKEGPNKGRQFYACPKPREQSCGFFEWADADDNGSGGASYGGGRGGGYGGGQTYKKQDSGGTKTKRKCGVCKQEGHNRKNCPQMQ